MRLSINFPPRPSEEVYMKTLFINFIIALTSVQVQAQLAPTWHIKANYDTLPCLSIQQTKALHSARQDGVESLVKEADIFHEKTKELFKKHKKFVCPPILENPPKNDKTIIATEGSSNAFESIYVVFPWQMEIMSGTAKGEIWKVNFDESTGVGMGKTKKLKNEFTIVPLIPRDADKFPYIVHSMKIPGHEKELIRLCYPETQKKECNPYAEIHEKPEF
jgi:hypothetical protein